MTTNTDNPEQTELKPPDRITVRVCRCGVLVAGVNACPHCGAGWAQVKTPPTEYARVSASSAAPVVGKELKEDFTKHLMRRHEELALCMKQECAKALDLIEQYTRPDFYAWLLMDYAGQKSDPYKRAAEAKVILQTLIESKPSERYAAASPASTQDAEQVPEP